MDRLFQHAANVRVWNNDETLYVKYVLDDDVTPTGTSDKGVSTLICKTLLAVSTSLDGIPQAENGDHIPVRFLKSVTHDPGVPEYTYEIPLASWIEGTRLFIAAHALIKNLAALDRLEPSLSEQVTTKAEVGVPHEQIDETAGAAGLDFVGKDWAMYLSYTLQ